MKHIDLREKLAELGITTNRIIEDTGLRKDTISHFFAGRLRKAGRRNCSILRGYLIELGLLAPRRKKMVLDNGGISGWALRSIAKEINKARIFQSSECESQGD